MCPFHVTGTLLLFLGQKQREKKGSESVLGMSKLRETGFNPAEMKSHEIYVVLISVSYCICCSHIMFLWYSKILSKTANY